MKFKRTYDIKKAISQKAFETMKEGKPFLYLVNDDFLFYNEFDVNNWIDSHDLMSQINRVLGHKTKANNGEPIYVIHGSEDIHSIIIPMETFNLIPDYLDFMESLEYELNKETR